LAGGCLGSATGRPTGASPATTVVVVALAEAERELLVRLIRAEIEAGADEPMLRDLTEILLGALGAEELRGAFSGLSVAL
jgi:hypothetical protein